MTGRWKYLYLGAVLLWMSSAAWAAGSVTRVVLDTELGELVLEVDGARAPKAAAYFLGFIDRGEYDGATFYRAGSTDQAPEVQLIQGGLFVSGLNRATPVRIEDFGVPALEQFDTTKDTGLRHEYATVSLARDLLDTGHVIPEIVIHFRDTPEMDYGGRSKPDERGFPAFGRVVEGMDVARAIAASELGGTTNISFLMGQILTDPVRITRAYRAP